MSKINLETLSATISEKIGAFILEILSSREINVHSIHIVGSVLTKDFIERTSDINSIIVLKEMDLKFVEFIAPLGKKYKKRGIAAPLIMTPEYISNSLDVFPIEFHNFKLLHKTVYGEDILAEVSIELSDLRNQCEREIKTKLIGLRQGYISSLGDRKILTDRIVSSFTGYLPLFRGLIFLMGREVPRESFSVIEALASATEIDISIFKKVLQIKKEGLSLQKEELDSLFEKYYQTTEKIGKLIDQHKI